MTLDDRGRASPYPHGDPTHPPPPRYPNPRRIWSTLDGRSGKFDGAGGASRGDKTLEDGSLSWENTIYVQGLPASARMHEIAEFFGGIGPIKKSKKSHNQGEPTASRAGGGAVDTGEPRSLRFCVGARPS